MSTGVMALEDSGRVNFTNLRTERRARLFAAMDEANLEVLILGRTSNIHYTTGARLLWRSGVFPFAPMCIVVRSTEKTHLLSCWDDGIPPEIGREDLFGLFWNPVSLIAALRAIPGLVEATRIGTDSFTPSFSNFLPTFAGTSEVHDAAQLMTSIRSVKTNDEIACMVVATTVAEAGLTALEASLEPGISERTLLSIFNQTIAHHGTPTPPSESVVFVTDRQGPVRMRHLATDRALQEGDLVVLAPGAIYAGYEGGLARTRVVGGGSSPAIASLFERSSAGLDALISACVPGGSGEDLYKAWASTGEPVPTFALAHGMGVGAEAPLIGFSRGETAILQEGSVLSVQSWVSTEGIGGVLNRELVRIGSRGPEILTRSERTS
jgi:Xaa-Pro aminopeptidase